MISIRGVYTPAMIAVVAIVAPAAATSAPLYGFRMGAAASSIHGQYDDFFHSKARLGFATAAYARFPLGGHLSFQPEVGWASKGDEAALAITFVPPGGPPTPETIESSFETRIDYVEIPLLLRLDIPTGWMFEPYVLGGPGVGFRTGSSRTVAFEPSTLNASGRLQRARIFEGVGTFDDPHFENVDWSAIAGAGLMFGRGPIRIVLDSRYTLGPVGIMPDTDRGTAYNGSWATTLGIELK